MGAGEATIPLPFDLHIMDYGILPLPARMENHRTYFRGRVLITKRMIAIGSSEIAAAAMAIFRPG